MLDSIANMTQSRGLQEITTDIIERVHTYSGLTLTAGTCRTPRARILAHQANDKPPLLAYIPSL